METGYDDDMSRLRDGWLVDVDCGCVRGDMGTKARGNEKEDEDNFKFRE